MFEFIFSKTKTINFTYKDNFNEDFKSYILIGKDVICLFVNYIFETIQITIYIYKGMF